MLRSGLRLTWIHWTDIWPFLLYLHWRVYVGFVWKKTPKNILGSRRIYNILLWKVKYGATLMCFIHSVIQNTPLANHLNPLQLMEMPVIRSTLTNDHDKWIEWKVIPFHVCFPTLSSSTHRVRKFEWRHCRTASVSIVNAGCNQCTFFPPISSVVTEIPQL